MAFSLAPLAGGALIGLSASWLMARHGRVAGISGIAGGLLQPKKHDLRWRLWFMAGLLVPGAVAAQWAPQMLQTADVPGTYVVLAGLLVGFGVRMGNGCTSGHGVCGLSRLSPRSLLAVLSFMTTGALVATFFGHGGWG